MRGEVLQGGEDQRPRLHLRPGHASQAAAQLPLPPARIFVDDQLNVPVRYEAYEWPRQPGGKPELIEEYTYLNLKLNNGFTDADFDTHNKDYHFR